MVCYGIFWSGQLWSFLALSLLLPIKGIVVRIPRQAILHNTNLKYGHGPNRYQTEFR